MKNIKTFEQACQALGLDANALPDFSSTPESHRKALLAHYKLVIICQALNEGWVPDWDDENEPKYVPYFKNVSGFGLAYCDYVYWRTRANVGSRLCFKSIDLLLYAVEQFKDIYRDYLTLNK